MLFIYCCSLFDAAAGRVSEEPARPAHQPCTSRGMSPGLLLSRPVPKNLFPSPWHSLALEPHPCLPQPKPRPFPNPNLSCFISLSAFLLVLFLQRYLHRFGDFQLAGSRRSLAQPFYLSHYNLFIFQATDCRRGTERAKQERQ